MHTLAYYLHDLNPVIFDFGPIKWLWGIHISPRWYGLSYLLGFLAAYFLLRKLAKDGMLRLPPDKVADLVLNCCIFGVLIGGRLGFVLFYDLPAALHDHLPPLLWQFNANFPYWGVLRVMDGGMSAHGGIIFTVLTLLWFARKHRVPLVNIGDAACMVVPVGLCFGRIANFINGELYGHLSSLPWAVKFPSELYAPTNGAQEITPAQYTAMRQAIGQYLGDHWQNLSAQQVHDFFANHPDLHDLAIKQFGTADPSTPALLEAAKQWIGHYVSTNVNAIPDRDFTQDIHSWWEHSHGPFHQLLHQQFDIILHPRHPSQLYEALLEGVLLFLIVWLIGRLWRKDGMAGGAFLTCYPIMRIIGEQFRVGDAALGWTHTHLGAGVIYSLLMLLFGIPYWLYWIRRHQTAPWNPVTAPAEPPPAPAGPQKN